MSFIDHIESFSKITTAVSEATGGEVNLRFSFPDKDNIVCSLESSINGDCFEEVKHLASHPLIYMVELIDNALHDWDERWSIQL